MAEGVTGKTLLDIGGGVGAIQHELLQAGAGGATNVDASSAYLNAARQEAERRGHAERVNYCYGNFVELAPQIEPVDIVTLDRVICCYHDMAALVGLSSARAGELYGVVYPRATWWMKLGVEIINKLSWLTRNPFRIFVHPTPAVEAIIHANGLKEHFRRQSLIWQVVVYRR